MEHAVIRYVPESQAVIPLPEVSAEVIEKALMIGDFSKMSADMRVAYYLAVCKSSGLNPMSRPFLPMKTQSGDTVLYATVQCAEQLRKIHRISTKVLSRETQDGLYIVTVLVSTPDGRTEESQGIVEITNLKGTAKANAMLKAESKAKRRATMAICGLGFPMADDASPREATPILFNAQTGEVVDDIPEARLTNEWKTAQAHIEDLCDVQGVSYPPTPLADTPVLRNANTIIEDIDTLLRAQGTLPSAYWVKVRSKAGVGENHHIPPSDLEGMLAHLRTRQEIKATGQTLQGVAITVPGTGVTPSHTDVDPGEEDDIPF